MHPYVLVPMLAAVGAAALASGIAVRDPRSPAHRLMAGVMLCAGLWSLGAVLWCTAPSAASALFFTRCAALPALAIAPLALHLLLELGPGAASRYRRRLAFSYGLTLVVASVWLTTPWLTVEMVRTSWGWSPVFTPWAPAAGALVVLPLLAAIASSLRQQRDTHPRRPLVALHLSAVLPLSLAAATDLVLPLQGIYCPPVGSAAFVVWGGAVWWSAYRFRESRLSPGDFAQQILETLATGVLLLRADGRIRAANARLAELAGREQSDLRGRPIGELLSGPCAAELGRAPEVDCELATAAGPAIPVAVSRAPLREQGGVEIGYVLAVHDLREVSALRNRLVTSGRLAAVGQLAAGIAHEINNPLAYVRANLGLLGSHWPDLEQRARKAGGEAAAALAQDDAPEMIAECREGVERIAAIVRDVGGFAREGPPTLESADLSKLLDTALRVATPQLRSRARVERDYATPLPLVRCVPQELMQVFLNLVLNAAQALQERGTIRLVTEARDEHVWVRVEDDGRGLPAGEADRIFDPFFTTKPVGEGTGLGLSISRQIVIKHGGEIGAEPRDAGGSVFWLRIPLRGPA